MTFLICGGNWASAVAVPSRRASDVILHFNLQSPEPEGNSLEIEFGRLGYACLVAIQFQFVGCHTLVLR
jgi:hypothetical protein